MGGHAGAGARARDPAGGAPRGGQQGGAGPAGHARDRQALRRVARRGPGGRRHLRLLPLGGPPPLRPDGAERDARQAAVHLPHAGRGGRDRHRRQLPGGGAVLVPRAGDPVRQRVRLEAGRLRAGARPGADRPVPARRRAGGRAEPGAGRRPVHLRGPRAGARRGARGQGGLHRLVERGGGDRGPVRAPPPVALPRAGRQEPAGGHARRRAGPGRGGRAVQRLRHGGAALHLARHGDRARVDPRRVHGALHARRRSRRRSATRPRTCSTGR